MVFKNVMIFDWEGFIENGFIRFGKKIEQVGSMDEYREAKGEKVYDLKGHLVMPGFINAHMHIYSTFARGMIIPYNPKSFKDILEQLWWKLDSKLDEEAVYMSGLVSAVELVKNGVTVVIDHHASGQIRGSLQALRRAVVDEGGLRGIFCFETSDRFNVDDCIRENLEFMESSSERHAGMFGLHASLSLSDETLEKVSKVLSGKPVHIHVAESEEDEADSLEKYGMRVVERLEKHALLNQNSILAHCVHVNERELEILKDRGVYIAVNPTSNMNNAVGLPDVRAFKEKDIPVIIGNDGLGYNITRDWMNIYFSQKLKSGSPVFYSLNDLKESIDAAYGLVSELLGVKLGRIKPGYEADMVVLKYTPPTPMNERNAAGHVFFGVFDKPDVRFVTVEGKLLMENGKLRLDEQEIFKEARVVARKVWERLS